ncbi:MAG: CinA family protein [Halobacteriaceae archaeon]
MQEFADSPPVEKRIGEKLRQEEQTIATAESCTGGMIGTLVTSISGSSDYYEQTYVTYSNTAKITDLAVTRETLDEYGAVSRPVARQMAQRARDKCRTDWAVSTTGIAGPTGGTDENPVGTVYIGLAFAGTWGTNKSFTTVERHEFDGDRQENRELASRQALELLESEIESRII